MIDSSNRGYLGDILLSPIDELPDVPLLVSVYEQRLGVWSINNIQVYCLTD